MSDGDRLLWREGELECRMISCCAGAELRLSRGEEIVLRELYPTKSDLYERARTLQDQARRRR
jgi:hypothetical protein